MKLTFIYICRVTSLPILQHTFGNVLCPKRKKRLQGIEPIRKIAEFWRVGKVRVNTSHRLRLLRPIPIVIGRSLDGVGHWKLVETVHVIVTVVEIDRITSDPMESDSSR